MINMSRPDFGIANSGARHWNISYVQALAVVRAGSS